ncbi:MAG TPA: 30S ribosomal protein S1 [Candidatus Dormibacteraeota bacterium]|nr:30S ribosomal protein S1 [Candidatus Dormibacteraeota bacterium]
MSELATEAPAEELTIFSSMEEYLRTSAESIRTLTYGDIVDGTVVRVDPDEVLVDIGAKSEGVISNRELTGRAEESVTLNPGDKIKVYVLQSENEDGNVVLSLRRARAEGIWAKAAEKESSGEGVEAEVREQNKGGLIVNIMGLRGFLPSSQVARTHSGNLMDLVGQQIMVKILEVNRKRNRLIVSQRAAQDEDRARQREELFERLSVGDVVTGRVSGLTSYGAFINLGGADGLIHISELSWDRVSNVSDMLAVGDEVTVKVIKLDPELSRISLSLRQMSDDPWDSIEARFPAGTEIEGIVTKTKKYGAFLQIADGVEGLLHISELSWEHVERTEDVLRVGDTVKVIVLQADRTRRRISLSYRQLLPRPAHLPPEEIPGDQDYAAAADYEPDMDEDSSPEPEPVAKPRRSRAKVAAAAETQDAAEADATPEVEGSLAAEQSDAAEAEDAAEADATPEVEGSLAAEQSDAADAEDAAEAEGTPEVEVSPAAVELAEPNAEDSAKAEGTAEVGEGPTADEAAEHRESEEA